MHHVARTNLRRRLCRVAVDVDVAAFAQLGRDGPGLDEAHRAQPAIDSCVVGHHVLQLGFVDAWLVVLAERHGTLEPVPPVAPIGMRKDSRGVDLGSVDDLDERQVASWMKQATGIPGFGGKKR